MNNNNCESHIFYNFKCELYFCERIHSFEENSIETYSYEYKK